MPAKPFYVHMMIEHPEGRIRSHATAMPGRTTEATGPVKTYAAACDVSLGLPSRDEHALTPDSRNVSCPACQQTPEFLADYELQVGHAYERPADQPTD